MTLTATRIVVHGEVVSTYPSSDSLKAASSIHVFAFSSHGELLLVESEGKFSIETWEESYRQARLVCRGEEEHGDENGDVSMDSKEDTNLEDVLREALQRKVAKEQKWKQNSGSTAT